MKPAFGRASKDARQQCCSLVREMPIGCSEPAEPSYITIDGCDLAAPLIRGRLAIFLLVLGINSGAR